MIRANEDASARIAKAASINKPMGVPGTSIYGGYVQENESNASVSGTAKYKTYSNILSNVAIVASGVRHFLNLISGAKWSLEPADDSPEAARILEEIELIKDNLKTPWSRIIRKTATYKFYGFGVQAWTASRMKNGVIGFSRIDARPQSTITRWMRDEFGDIEEIIQTSPQTYDEIIIPRSRCIYIVDDALNDSPEGLGLFRHLAEPARRLQRFEQLEGVGFETDLRGIPIGRGPYTQLRNDVRAGIISDEQRIAIELPMSTVIQNHIKTKNLGLLLDSMTYQNDSDGSPSTVRQWDFELLKAGSNSQPDVANAITRLTADLARVLHAEGLLLGSGPNGSQALSVDKSSNLALMVESTLTEIAETMNQDFIKPHAYLNGWDIDLMPKFKTESVSFKSVEEITKSLRDLAASGAILDIDDPAINHVRDLLNIPAQMISTDRNLQSDSALLGSDNTDIENMEVNDGAN